MSELLSKVVFGQLNQAAIGSMAREKRAKICHPAVYKNEPVTVQVAAEIRQFKAKNVNLHV